MRDAEHIIASAVERGAISPERAAFWRAEAGRGVDVSALELCAAARPERRYDVRPGTPMYAAARHPVTGQFVSSDPMYAANPLLAEMSASHPALVSSAMADDPNPPKLFGDRDLPAFTACGLDPQVLAALPWPLRRPVAAMPDLSSAYQMLDDMASVDPNDAALLEMRYSRANADYLAAFSAWLRGPMGLTQRHSGNDALTTASAGEAASDAYLELFGQSS